MKLTKTEMKILKLKADGLLTKEIADKLFIGFKTVEKHSENMKRKNDAKNTPHLIAIAFRAGIIATLFLCTTAKAQIVVGAQSYILPSVQQTFPATMLCTNKSTSWFSSNNAYSKEGYITLGGNQWTPIYLDDKKKLIDTLKIRVWFWIKK